jgi:hypothetical protein
VVIYQVPPSALLAELADEVEEIVGDRFPKRVVID